MTAFTTILVPVDGTRDDERVIPVALEEAIRHNARLDLLYVVERPEPFPHSHKCVGRRQVIDRQFDPETCHECAHAYTHLADLSQRHHLPAGTGRLIKVGDPIRHIEQQATANAQTLVIMPTITAEHDEWDVQYLRAEQLLRRGRCQLLLIYRFSDALPLHRQEIIEYSRTYVGAPL